MMVLLVDYMVHLFSFDSADSVTPAWHFFLMWLMNSRFLGNNLMVGPFPAELGDLIHLNELYATNLSF